MWPWNKWRAKRSPPGGFLVTNPNAQPLQTSHHRATLIDATAAKVACWYAPPASTSKVVVSRSMRPSPGPRCR